MNAYLQGVPAQSSDVHDPGANDRLTAIIESFEEETIEHAHEGKPGTSSQTIGLLEISVVVPGSLGGQHEIPGCKT